MKVAVLSDIHSNVPALDAVLASIGTIDAVWHLGDVVGYGPEPDAVVERLREIGAIGVRGNHDDIALLKGPVANFNSWAAIAAEWTRKRISPATRAYLDALPLALVPDGLDVTLVHGTPAEPLADYLTAPYQASDGLEDVATRHLLVGHSHLPLAFRRRADRTMEERLALDGEIVVFGEDRWVLNPGSVGQPRDRDPRASCMVVDTTAGTATWRRVAYDIAATQRRIIDARLPLALADRLSVGR